VRIAPAASCLNRTLCIEPQRLHMQLVCPAESALVGSRSSFIQYAVVMAMGATWLMEGELEWQLGSTSRWLDCPVQAWCGSSMVHSCYELCWTTLALYQLRLSPSAFRYAALPSLPFFVQRLDCFVLFCLLM
jgi:hypothetical protein